MKALANFPESRHTLTVDALRYSLVLERRAYSSMMRALRAIERQDDESSRPQEVLALRAISRAWEIIDITYRARGLALQVYGLSQRNPEVQKFRRAVSGAENFRHLYQHLNSELTQLSGKTNPIMGVVSWITKDPAKAITVFVGTGQKDTQVHTVAFDTQRNEFTPPVLFSAWNRDLDLYTLHNACKRYQRFLEDWLYATDHVLDHEAAVGIVRFKYDGSS